MSGLDEELLAFDSELLQKCVHNVWWEEDTPEVEASSADSTVLFKKC
jgi:hypothetical protein